MSLAAISSSCSHLFNPLLFSATTATSRIGTPGTASTSTFSVDLASRPSANAIPASLLSYLATLIKADLSGDTSRAKAGLASVQKDLGQQISLSYQDLSSAEKSLPTTQLLGQLSESLNVDDTAGALDTLTNFVTTHGSATGTLLNIVA